MLSLGGTTGNGRLYVPYGQNSEFGWGYAATWNAVTTALDTDPHIFTGIAGSTQGNFQPFIDGTSKGSATLASNATGGTYGIGGYSSVSAYAFNGQIAEVVVYSSDQSAKRTALEKNIMDYYAL
jgi:hypothetical protein